VKRCRREIGKIVRYLSDQNKNTISAASQTQTTRQPQYTGLTWPATPASVPRRLDSL